MKKLPKYFVILKDGTNPLWDKYIQWLRTTYNAPWSGNLKWYYGYDGNSINNCGTNCWSAIKRFENNPTLITLEYWNECVNEFQLSEKWCIRVSTEEIFEQFKQYVLKEPLKEKPMKKCTIEEIKTNSNLVVFIETEKQFDKIVKYVGQFVRRFYGPHCYNIAEGSYSSSSSRTYCGIYDAAIVQFDEIDFMDEERKIIGYKLVKSEMYKAASVILYSNDAGSSQLDNFISTVHEHEWIEKLKKAGVLDLWFEPVYEEKESFKVEDWIYITSIGSSVSCRFKETGERHYGASEGDVVQIKGIVPKYGNASESDPRYYGDNFNLRAKGFRKATPEEILEFKVKEFTEKTGIKVGSTIIAPAKIKGAHCWNNGWGETHALLDRDVLKFSIHPDGKTLLMQVSGTTDNIWYNAYKMMLANSFPSITIRGYKAEFTKDSVKFGCQTYSKEFVLKLAECLDVNDFDMDIKSEILEIAKYFKSLD